MRLDRYDAGHARSILAWIRSPDEADTWASVGDRPLGPEVFDRWHADEDVHPYVATDERRLVGYGEVWLEGAEAELARIVVDPAVRGLGVGRRLTTLLAEPARTAGAKEIWLRVVPSNAPAIAAYRAAGFARAGEDEEAAFNRGQPRVYVWMRLAEQVPVVTAVSRSGVHSLSKPNAERIRLLGGLGVEDDAHLGETVKHRSRVRRDPTQPNLRQVHLIHAELHDELRAAGFALSTGEMGENVTTRGVDLLALPTGTRLRLGEDAVIEVTGLRNPCVQLERIGTGLMEATLARDDGGRLVRKAGVMAIVVTGGEVRAGDAVLVELPAEPHRALEVV